MDVVVNTPCKSSQPLGTQQTKKKLTFGFHLQTKKPHMALTKTHTQERTLEHQQQAHAVLWFTHATPKKAFSFGQSRQQHKRNKIIAQTPDYIDRKKFPKWFISTY